MHTATFYLDRLEKHVKENDGYLVKRQLTWADLVFGSFTPLLNYFAGHDLFADRSHLKQLSDKIRSLPAIKTYLDKRPPHEGGSATRLVYFNISGLGEPVRFMLSFCGEQFEDERISMEEFQARKQSFPVGKLPYLEIDGMSLHQTMSMCRYLARKHDLTGTDLKQATQADVLVDTINDVRAGLVSYFDEKDEDLKQKKFGPAVQNAEYYLDRLENIVLSNGGHFVKDQLTWADVVFASLSSFLNHMAKKDLLATRPALRCIRDNIFANPKIKKYLDSRPQHAF